MKKLAALFGAIALVAILSGCEAPTVYGGAYGSFDGEYPSTYGEYYSGPVYPRYYHHWAPYDRDHYWDREHHWSRHGYHFGDRD